MPWSDSGSSIWLHGTHVAELHHLVLWVYNFYIYAKNANRLSSAYCDMKINVSNQACITQTYAWRKCGKVIHAIRFASSSQLLRFLDMSFQNRLQYIIILSVELEFSLEIEMSYKLGVMLHPNLRQRQHINFLRWVRNVWASFKTIHAIGTSSL